MILPVLRGALGRASIVAIWLSAIACGSSPSPAKLGDSQPHGCRPAGTDCPGVESCAPAHVCCKSVVSGCDVALTPDSSVSESFTPCSTDDDCAGSEYCQARISQCCPIGYLCDQVGRPATKTGRPMDASTEHPSSD